MNNKQILKMAVGFLLILGLFSLLGTQMRYRKKKVVGGCKGTEYGCCPDSRTACNRNCSNCFYSLKN